MPLKIILKSVNYKCVYCIYNIKTDNIISKFYCKGMLCVCVVRGEKYLQTGENDLVNMAMKK